MIVPGVPVIPGSMEKRMTLSEALIVAEKLAILLCSRLQQVEVQGICAVENLEDLVSAL